MARATAVFFYAHAGLDELNFDAIAAYNNINHRRLHRALQSHVPGATVGKILSVRRHHWLRLLFMLAMSFNVLRLTAYFVTLPRHTT